MDRGETKVRYWLDIATAGWFGSLALLSAAYLHTPQASRRRGVAPGRNMLLNAAPGQNMLLNAAPGRHVAETRCLLKHVIRSGAIPRPFHGGAKPSPVGPVSVGRHCGHRQPRPVCPCPGSGPEAVRALRLGAPPIVAIVALQRHYDEWHSEVRDNCELKRFPGQNYC